MPITAIGKRALVIALAGLLAACTEATAPTTTSEAGLAPTIGELVYLDDAGATPSFAGPAAYGPLLTTPGAWAGTWGPRDVGPRLPVLPADALAACTPQRAWWSEETGPDFVYGAPELQLSPGERLLARRDMLGDTYLRVRDGAPLGHDVRETSGPLDGSWSLRLVPGDGTLVRLIDVASGDVVLTLDEALSPGGDAGRVGSPGLALLEDQGLAVARSCWYLGDGIERATVTAWNLADGSRAWRTDLVGPCGTASWLETPWLLRAGAHHLVTAERAGPWLVELRISDGAVVAEAPIAPPDPSAARPQGSWYDERLLALAVRPGASELAYTTLDGQLVRLRLPDLMPLGAPIPVGVVTVNRMSYGPSVESPLAWSPGGTVVAHLAPNGEAMLFDVASGAELARLRSPTAQAAPWAAAEGAQNPATAFLFLSDADGLVVARERGVELWSCTGTAPVAGEPEPLAVTLRLPAAGTLDAPLSADVATVGGAGPIVTQLLRDGEPLAFASTLGRRIDVWLPEGTFQVTARADDGLTTASSAPASVTVTAAP